MDEINNIYEMLAHDYAANRRWQELQRERELITEALENQDLDFLAKKGLTLQSGWGVDCPGGDNVVSVVVRKHISGGDSCLWVWADPIMKYLLRTVIRSPEYGNYDEIIAWSDLESITGFATAEQREEHIRTDLFTPDGDIEYRLQTVQVSEGTEDNHTSWVDAHAEWDGNECTEVYYGKSRKVKLSPKPDESPGDFDPFSED